MLPELLFHLGCKPTAGAGRLCVISLSRRNYRKGPIVHDTSSLLYILLYQTKPVWRVIIEAPNVVAKPSILIHFEGPLDGLTSLVSEFDFYTGRTPLSWVVLSCFYQAISLAHGSWLTAWPRVWLSDRLGATSMLQGTSTSPEWRLWASWKRR